MHPKQDIRKMRASFKGFDSLNMSTASIQGNESTPATTANNKAFSDMKLSTFLSYYLIAIDESIKGKVSAIQKNCHSDRIDKIRGVTGTINL